jgi:hypothetical protein
VVRRAYKAVPIGDLLARLSVEPVDGCQLASSNTNDPEYLLVPRAANALIRQIGKIVQRAQKSRSRLPGHVPPAAVRELLRAPARCPSNRTRLGSPPNRVRLAADAASSFLSAIRPDSVVVEGLGAENVREMRAACGKSRLVAALPPVFFESDLERLRDLVRECVRARVSVEVNSWGGWRIAKEARATIEGGPGMAVLNSLAARTLGKLGFQLVTLSPEADRRKLERLTANCPVACSLIVYGRPPLMISRVDLPAEYARQLLSDRRDNQVGAARENDLWVLRPTTPFDLRRTDNERILARHLEVDLIGSPDPVREWCGDRRGAATFTFNYRRKLV